jgi:hypothetical protein
MPLLNDISGKVFGALLVLSRAPNTSRTSWFCKCKCGKITQVIGQNLMRGFTASCGSFECKHGSHGHCRGGVESTEYNTWRSMFKRCRDKNHPNYKNYGGRGIKICKRWQKFESFIADMGKKPDGCVIDRINFNGDYEPNNCRWATHVQSAANRRKAAKHDVSFLHTKSAVANRVKSMKHNKLNGLVSRQTQRRKLK